MDCKEFLIVGGSAGTQVGTNEGNMVSCYIWFFHPDVQLLFDILMIL